LNFKKKVCITISIAQKNQEFDKWYLSLFKNVKNQNFNKFIYEGKMGVSIHGESPCILLLILIISSHYLTIGAPG